MFTDKDMETKRTAVLDDVYHRYIMFTMSIVGETFTPMTKEEFVKSGAGDFVVYDGGEKIASFAASVMDYIASELGYEGEEDDTEGSDS